MATIPRQNALFIAEDWTRIYEALDKVDFKGTDFDTLLSSVMDYIRVTHPDEFNDFIASSEFVMKVEIMAWLFQNLAFRLDLNVRENVLSTAERKQSLINMAHMIGYKVSRLRSAYAMAKVTSVSTTENIIDSNGTNIAKKKIVWNDKRNADWYEHFIRVMNAAFVNRTPFNKPKTTYVNNNVKTKEYLLRTTVPTSGEYAFTVKSSNGSTSFGLHSSSLDKTTGVINEKAPNDTESLAIYYLEDGLGYSSKNTGFFFPLKEGVLTSSTTSIAVDTSEPFYSYDIPSKNIAEGGVFVQGIDTSGNVLNDWTEIDNAYGEGVNFNILSSETQNVFEVLSLKDDGVRLQFGDGNFGTIPSGIMRFWYRIGNPTPTKIEKNDFGKQSVSMPYFKDNKLHQITFTIELVDTVSNGAPSELSSSIRNKAGKVFYTQNRMVTGQDYNNFFLRDNRIKKAKSINHSFVGQSRYSKLIDPAGLYENIKQVGSDGRIFMDEVRHSTDIDDDAFLVSVNQILDQTIQTELNHESIRYLGELAYPEVYMSDNWFWKQTSISGTVSSGNVVDSSGKIMAVGSTTTGEAIDIDVGANIRVDNIRGQSHTVVSLTGDGTTSGSVSITGISDGSKVFSVLPNIRKTFTTTERQLILDLLKLKQDFGIRWDQGTREWKAITSVNLDKTSEFSLTNAGSTTGSKSDASWAIMVEYIATTSGNKWRVTRRGKSIGFESETEIDFFYTNLSDKVKDPITGKTVRDSIEILPCAESKNSLRRRGLDKLTGSSFYLPPLVFTGDGTTKCFTTSWSPLDVNKTVVIKNNTLQASYGDYTITRNPSGDSICFRVAPKAGDRIVVYYESKYVQAQFGTKYYTADGTTTNFTTGAKCVDLNNTLVFIDSVMQVPLVDYSVFLGNNEEVEIIFNTAPPASTKVTIAYVYGINGDLFARERYTADGTSQTYTLSNHAQSYDTSIVAIDGIVQSPADTTVAQTTFGATMTFDTAPAANNVINILTIDGRNVCDSPLIRTAHVSKTGDGTTSSYVVNANTYLDPSGHGIHVFIDGVYQQGPWAGSDAAWTVSSDSVSFATAPGSGTKVHIIVMYGAIGLIDSRNPITDISRIAHTNTKTFIGDGNSKSFDLGTKVSEDNVLVWWDSVAQYSSKDWTVLPSGSGNSTIVFNSAAPAGVNITVNYYSNTSFTVFTNIVNIGDGTTTEYTLSAPSLTSDDLLVFFDGILQSPSLYTVTGGTATSKVTFNVAPTNGIYIDMIYVPNTSSVKNKVYEFTADGTTSSFTLTDFTVLPVDGKGILVFQDGVMQLGPWASVPSWTLSGNVITFVSTPSANSVIQIFALTEIPSDTVDVSTDKPNQIPAPRLDVASDKVNFIGDSVILTPTDRLYHADGYVNKNGLMVTPADTDSNNVSDKPTLFNDLVYGDGYTDLVLWQKVNENGFATYQPLGKHTTPRGFYGSSTLGNAITDGTPVDTGTYVAGDIFYNADIDSWLYADTTTGVWTTHPTQGNFKKRIGRGDLPFKWTHYSPHGNRISPAPQNIIHTFILTDLYDTAYRNWLDSGSIGPEPSPDTSEGLAATFGDMDKYKMVSDSIVYYPIRYKKLFGSDALPMLQAKFQVVQSPGSTMSESDLKLRILALTNTYFDPSRWEIGEQDFYFTELAAFIHSELAPNVASIVIVPADTSKPFGTMFQIRSEPDELFISTLSASDIEIVSTLDI